MPGGGDWESLEGRNNFSCEIQNFIKIVTFEEGPQKITGVPSMESKKWHQPRKRSRRRQRVFEAYHRD